MSTNVLRVPRETTEFQEIIATVDGEQVTDLQIAFTRDDDRPVAWTPAILVDGKTGFTITGMEPGTYSIWMKISTGADTPVRFAGVLIVT